MGNRRMHTKRAALVTGWIVAGGLLMACGGGGAAGKGAASGDDADAASGDGEGKPAAVTNDVSADDTICIDSTIGQRYLVEDALSEAGIETVDNCLTADVMLQERGESGAYELRYQKVGAGEWASCESSLEKQLDFLESCVREIFGGGAVATTE